MSLKLFLSVFCLCFLKVNLSEPENHVDEETNKILKKYGITDPNVNEKLLAQRVVYEREEKKEEQKRAYDAVKDKNFFQKISSLTFICDVEDDFVEDYLSRCVGYSLKRAPGHVIASAYHKFFDYRCIGNRKGVVSPDLINMADEMRKFMREKHWTKYNYLRFKDEARTTCNDYIHMYRKYCMEEFDSDGCNLIIEMAPTIRQEIKEIYRRIYRDLRPKPRWYGKN